MARLSCLKHVSTNVLLSIVSSCHQCLRFLFFLFTEGLSPICVQKLGSRNWVWWARFIDYNQTFYSTPCTCQVLSVICLAEIYKTHCQNLGRRPVSSDWGGDLIGQYLACRGEDPPQPPDIAGPHPVLKSPLSSELGETSLCHSDSSCAVRAVEWLSDVVPSHQAKG